MPHCSIFLGILFLCILLMLTSFVVTPLHKYLSFYVCVCIYSHAHIDTHTHTYVHIYNLQVEYKLLEGLYPVWHFSCPLLHFLKTWGCPIPFLWMIQIGLSNVTDDLLKTDLYASPWRFWFTWPRMGHTLGLPRNLPWCLKGSLVLQCPLLKYACSWEEKVNSNIGWGLLITAGPRQRKGTWDGSGNQIQVQWSLRGKTQEQKDFSLIFNQQWIYLLFPCLWALKISSKIFF